LHPSKIRTYPSNEKAEDFVETSYNPLFDNPWVPFDGLATMREIEKEAAGITMAIVYFTGMTIPDSCQSYT
jgi:hypothetical protein